MISVMYIRECLSFSQISLSLLSLCPAQQVLDVQHPCEIVIAHGIIGMALALLHSSDIGTYNLCDQVLENHPCGHKKNSKYLVLKAKFSTHIWVQ